MSFTGKCRWRCSPSVRAATTRTPGSTAGSSCTGQSGNRAWLHPVAVGLFGGTDAARRGRATRRDLREWSVIGAWTRNVLASALAIGTRGGAAGPSAAAAGQQRADQPNGGQHQSFVAELPQQRVPLDRVGIALDAPRRPVARRGDAVGRCR
jgi:hypothetical protein